MSPTMNAEDIVAAEATTPEDAIAAVATEVAKVVAEDVAEAVQAADAAVETAEGAAVGDTVMEEVTVTESTGPTGETVTTTEITTADPQTAEATTTVETTVEGGNSETNNGIAAEPTEPASTDPKDPLNLPPHGTEVFVGGIPRDATEDQIREFAAKIGKVHSVKMSFDPVKPGQHRGYGFVRYFEIASADKAKETLNGTKLEGTESLLRVSNSQSKYRLYFGNLPRSWDKQQITDEINKHSKGLEKLELVMSKEVPTQHRGFAFATFYNHECAAAAKDAFSKPSYKMDGRTLTVSYAEPKFTDEQAATPVKSRAVYVGNLPSGATDEKLKELFTTYGEVVKVVIPPATERRPEQRFCFVHFEAQDAADSAVSKAEAGEKPTLDDNQLEVKAAKPQENKLETRLQYDMGYGRGGRGRGFGRGPPMRGVRGGRGGRGPPPRLGPNHYAQQPYDQSYGAYDPGYGYDASYAGYDQGYGAYDQGYAGYDQYGGYAAQAAPAAAGAAGGMTMVPMMLPSGQVGYVLSDSQQQGGDYGSYTGPDRDYSNGRGRGRGTQRYRPY